MVITLATAWSGQFPQFYHTFPSRASAPMEFRPFFQDPLLSQRYFVNQPQFRQPLEMYQPLTPPPTVMRPNLQPPRVIPTAPLASNQVTPTDVHHHVYYYYFYLPLKGEIPMTGRNGVDDGRVPRQPCGDNRPTMTAECPPVYLPPPPPPPPPSPSSPPPSPTPSTPTTTQNPTSIVSVSPPSQGPCNDDTVVVDNVEYYPFGRTPIVVAPENSVRDGSENGSRDRPEQKPMYNTQPNFILANYLLPPDK